MKAIYVIAALSAALFYFPLRLYADSSLFTCDILDEYIVVSINRISEHEQWMIQTQTYSNMSVSQDSGTSQYKLVPTQFPLTITNFRYSWKVHKDCSIVRVST